MSRKQTTRRVGRVRTALIGAATAGSIGLAAVLGLSTASGGAATATVGNDSATTTQSGGGSHTSTSSGLVSPGSGTAQATTTGS